MVILIPFFVFVLFFSNFVTDFGLLQMEQILLFVLFVRKKVIYLQSVQKIQMDYILMVVGVVFVAINTIL